MWAAGLRQQFKLGWCALTLGCTLTDTRRPVKVYMLNEDQQWDNQGTRHVLTWSGSRACPWISVPDKTWSTGDGNGKPLQCSCLENPMNSVKMQKDMTLKDKCPPGWLVSNMLLGKSREIVWERMKRLSQSGNDAQFWMCLLMEVKSNAVKKNTA